MVFDWGRATLGTIPFVTLGVRYGGVKGGLIGIALGCAVFGVIGVATGYGTTAALARRLLAGERRRRVEAMTLNDILHSAQGGRAVDNLAARYGLTSEQAEAATQDMVAAFSTALERLKAHPEALGGLIAEVAGGAHEPSYMEPAAADGAAGADAVTRVFGSSEAIREAAQHAARAAGVAPETIEAMLPAVASILLGGLAHAMADQGLSGVLGDLASAAASPGGLGAALGSPEGSGGGFIGMLNSIFGGAHEPVVPQTAALVAGLTTLSGMFAAGLAASQANQASLNAVAATFGQPQTPT